MARRPLVAAMLLSVAALVAAQIWPKAVPVAGQPTDAGPAPAGPLAAEASIDYVRAGLQAGTMCESDYVVWVAANAGSVVHISTVRDYLQPDDRCHYACGGLCPGQPLQRTFLMGPFTDGGLARQSVCAAIQDRGRYPISSPCPYWIKIGGNVYHLTSSPSSFCGWRDPTPENPTPVPTGSSGSGACVPVPATPTPFVPSPTPTPVKVQLKGEVYAIPELDLRMPLLDVPVILEKGGREVARTVTQRPDAAFDFGEIDRDDDYVLRVELRNVAGGEPGIFRIAHGARIASGGQLVYAETRPFSTKDAATPLYWRFIFDPSFNDPPLVSAPGVPLSRLDDLGAIYFHAHQAWELADSVTQRLDYGTPIDIVAFSASAGVHWEPVGGVPEINIEVAGSAYSDPGRPNNREWHEFGHHVMADAFGNQMPEDPAPCPAAGTRWADCNHMGAYNVSTTDSWTEGFAEFYSTMVARNIVGEPRPEIYGYAGTFANLEANYMSYWANGRYGIPMDEEFAVAGLLFDLVDGENALDATDLGDAFADCVSVSFSNRLWDILTRDWGDVGRSPVAPAGVGHIFDVKQLYDVLKLEGVGAAHSRERDTSDLDELFLAHGFWSDDNLNGRYDDGEEIGRAAYPRQPVRRHLPPTTGSYVAYDAVEADAGNPVTVTGFDVEVDFAPPADFLDYAYTTAPGDRQDRLYIVAPPVTYEAEIRISARAPGSVSAEPLVIPNHRYHELMTSQPDDFFLTHTFEMVPAPRVFLPRAETASGAVTFAAAAAGSFALAGDPRKGAQATATRFPVQACGPATPVPTPSPTATASPAPGAPVVDAVVPGEAEAGSDVAVTVYGYNFQPGAVPAIGPQSLQEVEYLGPEPGPPNRDRLRGNLPSGLGPDLYDVIVVNPGGRAGALPNGFRVLAASAAPTDTATPSRTATLPSTATSTPSPTFTPTPSPTVTPANAVWLGRMFTTNPSDRLQSAFASLDQIKLWLEVPNTTGGPAPVPAEWRVIGPGGFEPPGLSLTDTLTVDPDRPFWTITRSLPTDIPVGEYVFRGSVTWAGRVFSDEIRFYVGHFLDFAYDFDNSAGEWPIGNIEGGGYALADGGYSLRVDAPRTVLWAAAPDSEQAELAFEAAGRQSMGTEGNYGLVVGLSDDASRYTVFRVDARGRYAVHRVDRDTSGATWTTLAPWTTDAAILRGGTANHLMLARRGTMLALYANGRYLTTVDDPTLPPAGRQGLIAGSLDQGGVEVRFDDVRQYGIVP